MYKNYIQERHISHRQLNPHLNILLIYLELAPNLEFHKEK